MIVPHKKTKKKRTQSIKFWRNKADKKFQEIGREMYNNCLICGGEYSCLHHVFTKGSCTYLRYSWKNVIPICAKHHIKIHGYEPVETKSLMDRIVKIKGQDWYDELTAERNKNRYTNANYVWYREMYQRLLLVTPNKVKK